ncbi:MAG: EVE domain-containing protein [Nostocaceae cyanobacterium]|nr:EVE domain-containing protein [Nostocaceae cyanobacterium]
MAYWLLKTEPEDYTYDDLERDGSTVWDGVSNNLALKHLRNMQIGDLVLIYHTGKQRRIMGIAKVVTQPYPDPSLNDCKRAVIDLHPSARVSQPVTLKQIKQDGHFHDFDLLKLPRLSVVPVSEAHWQRLLELGNGE